MKLNLLAPIFLAASTFAFAQQSVGLAGFGYAVPEALIAASPGQVLMFTVTGLRTHIVAPLPFRNVPLPRELGGVSVSLVQNGRETAAPLFGVQQSDCATPNCARATSITIQMPFELGMALTSNPTLAIRENGVIAGSVSIRPVSDSIRLIRNCDLKRTLVHSALEDEEPCRVRMLNITRDIRDGQASKAGDYLHFGAFGLGPITGAVTGERPTSFISLPVGLFELSIEFAPNAAPRRMTSGSEVQRLTPHSFGLSDIGVYQITLFAPALPAGALRCDGKTILSNATITLAGANSLDGLQLCLE